MTELITNHWPVVAGVSAIVLLTVGYFLGKMDPKKYNKGFQDGYKQAETRFTTKNEKDQLLKTNKNLNLRFTNKKYWMIQSKQLKKEQLEEELKH